MWVSIAVSLLPVRGFTVVLPVVSPSCYRDPSYVKFRNDHLCINSFAELKRAMVSQSCHQALLSTYDVPCIAAIALSNKTMSHCISKKTP